MVYQENISPTTISCALEKGIKRYKRKRILKKCNLLIAIDGGREEEIGKGGESITFCSPR